MIRRFLGSVGAALALLVAGCGGGGGSSGDCGFGDCTGSGGGTAVVADLILTLDTQSVTNSGSEVVTATITAVDSSRVVVSGATVGVAVDANALVTASSSSTGTDGKVTATVAIGADRSNRIITLTATSGSLTKTASISVTGSRIGASLATTVEPGSTGNTIRYRVLDVNSNPLVGQAIAVSAPGLVGATGVTSANGDFDFVYTAPSTSGALVITATSVGVTDVQTVQVQAAGGGVPVANGPVSSASVSANPKTVASNTAGSTTNQTQIRALFQAAGNVPIQNVRVRFDLNGDPNSVGGTISSGTRQLYSTADGVVTTSYIPGTRSSPTDGVSVRACWDYADFAAGTCPNATTVKLTVTAEPISVTLGTNELIIEGETQLTYIKQFVVMVVDSAGVAQANVTISPLLDLTEFRKGSWVVSGTKWAYSPVAFCTNEDTNRNGVLDSSPVREDRNGNSVLEPRKADVSVRMVNGSQTDAGGMAILQIEYPKNVASWDVYKLTVSATGVTGTEGVASFTDLLSVPASAVNSTTSSPAFQTSPYGTGSCTDPD